MKTEFTPGPWFVTEWPDGSPSIDSKHNTIILQCYYNEQPNGLSKTNQIGNAHLIAAAPDLLEALQDGVELMEYLINATPTGKVRNTMCDFNIIAQAAIKKALNLA